MANCLTGIRLLLILPVSWGLARPELLPAGLLTGLILLAIATDYFDGKVARARGTASDRGRFLDHGADFLFVTCGLGGLALQGVIHPVLPLLIVVAFSQYVLDSWFLYRLKKLRMSFLGRWNGVFYFAPLLLFAVAGLELPAALQQGLSRTGAVVAQILVLTTLASIIDRGLAPLRTRRPDNNDGGRQTASPACADDRKEVPQ